MSGKKDQPREKWGYILGQTSERTLTNELVSTGIPPIPKKIIRMHTGNLIQSQYRFPNSGACGSSDAMWKWLTKPTCTHLTLCMGGQVGVIILRDAPCKFARNTTPRNFAGRKDTAKEVRSIFSLSSKHQRLQVQFEISHSDPMRTDATLRPKEPPRPVRDMGK